MRCNSSIKTFKLQDPYPSIAEWVFHISRLNVMVLVSLVILLFGKTMKSGIIEYKTFNLKKRIAIYYCNLSSI